MLALAFIPLTLAGPAQQVSPAVRVEPALDDAGGSELEMSETVERATQRYADRLGHKLAELEEERIARRPILRSLTQLDEQSDKRSA